MLTCNLLSHGAFIRPNIQGLWRCKHRYVAPLLFVFLLCFLFLLSSILQCSCSYLSFVLTFLLFILHFLCKLVLSTYYFFYFPFHLYPSALLPDFLHCFFIFFISFIIHYMLSFFPYYFFASYVFFTCSFLYPSILLSVIKLISVFIILSLFIFLFSLHPTISFISALLM